MAITTAAAAASASSSLRFLPFSTPPPPPTTTQHSSLTSVSWRQRIRKVKSLADGEMLGDFGGRDPFPAEIESAFGDKVGNFNTEHRILIPNITSLSLSHQKVVPQSPLPISHQDAQSLLRKIVGWRLVDDEKVGGLKLQGVWKLRDFKCGVELINRIYGVVEVDGHYPNLHLEQNPNQVRAELWTSSIGK